MCTVSPSCSQHGVQYKETHHHIWKFNLGIIGSLSSWVHQLSLNQLSGKGVATDNGIWLVERELCQEWEYSSLRLISVCKDDKCPHLYGAWYQGGQVDQISQVLAVKLSHDPQQGLSRRQALGIALGWAGTHFVKREPPWREDTASHLLTCTDGLVDEPIRCHYSTSMCIWGSARNGLDFKWETIGTQLFKCLKEIGSWKKSLWLLPYLIQVNDVLMSRGRNLG